MEKGMPIRCAGMAWYEASSYEQVKAIMEDGHKLPSTFKDFLRQAESMEHKLKGEGVLVVRAIILPGEFEAWCRANGQRVNAEGRMAFANWIAYKTHGQTH